jgi:hypothetical protein
VTRNGADLADPGESALAPIIGEETPPPSRSARQPRPRGEGYEFRPVALSPREEVRDVRGDVKPGQSLEPQAFKASRIASSLTPRFVQQEASWPSMTRAGTLRMP